MYRVITEKELPQALSFEFSRIKKYLESISFTVGVHGANADEYPDGITVAEIAVIQTYGSKKAKIPSRPFIKPGVIKDQSRIISRIKDGIKQKEDASEIVESSGEAAVEGIVDYMIALKIPPNALSTIRKKGANNPLIDTGQLKASISSKATK